MYLCCVNCWFEKRKFIITIIVLVCICHTYHFQLLFHCGKWFIWYNSKLLFSYLTLLSYQIEHSDMFRIPSNSILSFWFSCECVDGSKRYQKANGAWDSNRTCDKIKMRTAMPRMNEMMTTMMMVKLFSFY